jgi:hypothetical protein
VRLLEDLYLQHSIEIRTSPERIFEFFRHLHLGENYRRLHPEDHVLIHWVRGEPWQEGSVVYAEQYAHGKLHKLKYIITRVVPNREIEFSPLSRFLRIYFPRNTFSVEQRGYTSVFTATVHIRVGWLMKKLARKKFEAAIESARKHVREEGENLKDLLEDPPH